jgi:alcohol dehydrogenase class IV
MNKKKKAVEYLEDFKGNNYMFGLDCINEIGKMCIEFGKNVMMIATNREENWSLRIQRKVEKSLLENNLRLTGSCVDGARPNAPREDVFRIAEEIAMHKPDVIVTIGGGSSIDATKAAVAYNILCSKYPDLDDYFGVNQVTQMLNDSGRKMIPVMAVQVAAGSAAHLTKYSNITDISTGQKMLIVDDSVVPPKALFDYRLTTSQPKNLTMDGGLDGISHCLEVYMGISEENRQKAENICLLGIDLIVNNIKKAITDRLDLEAKEMIGLGTDLGGYAIMIGGTNGAHLNSFSMTDILSHGRACALMNPYYVVFFTPAIEERIRKVGEIYNKAGYIKEDLNDLYGTALGIAVAEGMRNLSKDIGFPTALNEVTGFTDKHIERCLSAAKNPKLESKLKNMPVPLTADKVDEYMGAVLYAARDGHLNLIKEMN